MPRSRLQRALLILPLAIGCAAQNPKSITYVRLSPQLVEQRLQPPAASEDWSEALRKLYLKAGIPGYQLVEQTVPGSKQRMVLCTIKGTGDGVIVVSATLARPKKDDASAVAWASLAMLPLLAESLNAVSTDDSIVLIALPGEEQRHPGSSWYVRQLDPAQRKRIRAAVQVAEVGRGAPTFDVKHSDRELATWLATSALSLGITGLAPSAPQDSADFGDTRTFRSAGIPAITVSSQPQMAHPSFTAGYMPVNKLQADLYYREYQLLCVFLLELDRTGHGSATEPGAPSAIKTQHAGSVFTENEASSMIARQIGEVRDSYGAGGLQSAVVVELHDLVCEMARSNQLDPAPFQGLLEKKHLQGKAAVLTGPYPGLSPEQLQGLKIRRFHKLSVATCVLPAPEQQPRTYWIAALVYE